MRTASPTSRTIVVQGRLHLILADCDSRLSSDIPKRYTGARDTTFARSARNNWIPKRDGYIHTYIQTISEMRRRISCLALRRSATRSGDFPLNHNNAGLHKLAPVSIHSYINCLYTQCKLSKLLLCICAACNRQSQSSPVGTGRNSVSGARRTCYKAGGHRGHLLCEGWKQQLLSKVGV